MFDPDANMIGVRAAYRKDVPVKRFIEVMEGIDGIFKIIGNDNRMMCFVALKYIPDVSSVSFYTFLPTKFPLANIKTFLWPEEIVRGIYVVTDGKYSGFPITKIPMEMA